MPIQRIQFGSKIIESSKNLSWTRILELSDYLRKFAYWNPEEKIWIVNWRFFPNLDIVRSMINYLKNVDPKYAEQLSNILMELRKAVPEFEVSKDRIFILADRFDPYEIVKDEKYKDLDPRLIRRNLEIKGIGNLEVPYVSFSIRKISQYVHENGYESLPELLKKYLDENFLEKYEPRIEIHPISPKYVRVSIPSSLAWDSLLYSLSEIGNIRYYYEDINGELVEKKQEIVKIKKLPSGDVKILLPSYALSVIEHILKSYNIKYQINYGVPLRSDVFRYLKPDELFLLDHQKEALAAWMNAGCRGTIVIPTGGGKTFIALAAIAEKRVPSLILVPNKWLLHQWADRISRYLGIPRGFIGILGGGEQKVKDITVATYQSAYKYVEKLSEKFAMVFFDEAHHVPARTFKNVALFLRAPYRMALSATPKRRDNNEILLFKLAGGIVYKISYQELVRRGILAPVAIRKILVPLPVEYRLIYSQLEKRLELADNEVEKRKILNKLIEIARDNPIKLEVIRELIKNHKDDKIFVFAGSIKFAEKIAETIKKILPTALLTSKTDKSKESFIQRAFIRGDIRCIVLIKKGEEGVDVGDASVAIIAGGSKQEREFIQRVGRVLRGGKGKLAWVYEIVTENSVEELISRARGARDLVSGLENFIRRKFGIDAYRVVRWKKKIINA
ncbi:MAG: DEAD/DEAH box helicase [Candidatus Njordarchaeales archaeon]